MLTSMGKLGLVLMVAAAVALVGCSTRDLSASPSPDSSVSAVLPPSVSASGVSATAPVSSPARVSSTAPAAPSSVPRPSRTTAVPPVASATAVPAPAPGDAAFLTQLKTLSVPVADEQATVAQGHRVCTQFGEHVGYNQVASGIIDYNSDDARNVITAAVLTLCPQYKGLVGG